MRSLLLSAASPLLCRQRLYFHLCFIFSLSRMPRHNAAIYLSFDIRLIYATRHRFSRHIFSPMPFFELHYFVA